VTPLKPIPWHALSGLGVRATIQYLRMVDGLGQMRARAQSRAQRA